MPARRKIGRRDALEIIQPDGDPQSLRSMGARFLEALRIKNQTSWTAYTRARTLSYFFKWCDEREVKLASEVTRPILKRYQKALYYHRQKDGKPLNVSTQAQRLVALRMFFGWLIKNDFIMHDPASGLELPKVGKRIPRGVLSIEEVERVMQQPNVGEALGVRDRAILETLYSTGIRRGELCHLLVGDVDQCRGTLLIRQGKGQKDRVVPIGDRALDWVRRYLGQVRPRLVVLPDEGRLFLTAQGRDLLENPLGDAVRRYLKAAGIEGRGCCHLFRHSCATAMLEGGADIRYIQQMLGHSDLNTTAIYARVAIGKLKEVHRQTHPGAKR